MNDLERDLRDVLHEDARRVPTPTRAPERLRRSVRRRQAVFAGLVGLSALAIVAGIATGAGLLLSKQGGTVPAAETTTGTLNGITITYPQAWHLIDPDTVGLNGSPMMSEVPLPRIVLALAPEEPGDSFGCPGRSSGGGANFLMTVQEEPLAQDAGSWPTSLEPMTVGASESACYPDWEFLRAGWTIADRTFEARIGFAPDLSDEDRNAVNSAFASMGFAPSTGGPTSATLASGTAGGEDWQLVASHTEGGLSIDLVGETTGTGVGTPDDASTDLRASDVVLGSGSQAERLVFGIVPEGVVRVEASTVGDPSVSADVLDVPNEIARHLNAFVLVVDPSGPVTLTGYDGSGHAVATGSVTVQSGEVTEIEEQYSP